ncbi:MAG TPA: ABC transporter substrate-binding protein [Candidatus Limnocylindrales bacterium]|nr:ABC transporter substrate-binding protein [Candidatus Limnocylindrales bacterium]
MNKDSCCSSRTKFFQRIIVGIAVFLAGATFTRLSAAQTRSRVIVAHGVGIYSLNPYAVNTSPLTAAWGSVMESLIEPDYEKRGYRGVLAESWQLKGTRLEFKLRKGVRFHDGSPFTAADVVASFKRILTDKNSLQSPNLEMSKTWRHPTRIPSSLT